MELTLNQLMKSDRVSERLQTILGKNPQSFITNILQTVNDNESLSRATPNSILNAAATAAAMGLPITNSLGLAYIVPYGKNAQLQIGWRGFVQLALRTSRYRFLNVCEVYENQFFGFNKFTEEFDLNLSITPIGKVHGYIAGFELVDGFRKVMYWTMEDVVNHAKKYSKSYTSGPWKNEFEKMAKKTVLKRLIHNWGPLSIEMQQAIRFDQSVQDVEQEPVYVDNDKDFKESNKSKFQDLAAEKEMLRVINHIATCSTLESLQKVSGVVETYDLVNDYQNKFDLLSSPNKD
jgi:recombination protein RecT